MLSYNIYYSKVAHCENNVHIFHYLDMIPYLIAEYDMLDSKLDELNTALDFLEQKNDDIHEKLKDLLKSSIDIRQQLQSDTQPDK